MKHLLENWETIRGELQRARNLFLLLDYDGTLTPIVSRPEKALCPSPVRRHLEALRDLAGVHPAIISGRSLEDVREKVGVSGIIYVGNHGLEVENPAGRHRELLSPARRRELQSITRHLRKSLKDIPGILFEEKGPILSVHYRNVSQTSIARIPQVVEEELEKWKADWKMASGKMVFEIRPNIPFNKGDAIREILKAFPPPGRLSVYLGDDRTDEDVFRMLKGKGISVHVGSGRFPSEADFFLRDPGEVQEFLLRCLTARTKNC